MRLALPLLLLCAVLAMSHEAIAQQPAKPSGQSPIVRADNQFAVDLYCQLNKEQPDQNLFFSPASISVALGMTAAGARGETQIEMAKTLHLDDNLPSAHSVYHELLKQWNAVGEKRSYQLRAANRLWCQKGYPIRPEFLDLTREQYGAEMLPLDFAQSQTARAEINQWIEKQTNGKIKDVIAAGALNEKTRLVLTNAVYFKGDWENPFDKANTQPQEFEVSAARKVKTPLMHQEEKFGYAEEETLQVLEMPYAGHELSMLVLLPKKTDGLPALEKSLSLDRLEGMLATLHTRQVNCYIPKFKMEATFGMKPTLEVLGMRLAFSQDADFSGITAKEALCISAVVHKALVDVNEEGTEAAAATGEPAAPTAVVQRPQPTPVFRADHPFLFAIRDVKSGSILFMGRVLNPTE